MMKYGCIGEHLKHSFSKEVHGYLADYDYEILEIPRDGLGEFAERKEFTAVNVTIPYKEQIILYLDGGIDDFAKAVGAVNTVVNRDGRLYGYNTDFYGMTELFRHAGVDVEGRKCAILGTGGTAKTACAVLKALGAREILPVSRQIKDGSITYGELYEDHRDTEIIVNTTPVGMYPSIDGCPVKLAYFHSLKGVIDAVYNPLRTSLVLEAKERGVPAEGGLYMLVAQAVRASEIFLNTEHPAGITDEIYGRIIREKENIVLVGMPSSGKTTVGSRLAEAMGRALTDTDEEVCRRTKMTPAEIIRQGGEDCFRDLEMETVAEVAKSTCSVIATGGGAILRYDNVFQLKKNGRIYFLDRPLEMLTPTDDRPLSSSREALKHRYEERYPIYYKRSDLRIKADGAPKEVAAQILEDFNGRR